MYVWLRYSDTHLRSNIKRGNISTEEEEFIIRLHRFLGNRCMIFSPPPPFTQPH
uniref:Uncharacterized protein n=1 Tax=Nelumbo nucifera TaxID=4432 RepID=A0A822ZI22_NELNU|nr:TPA_asm: hypothetical protein HUJ06_001541 [Nelumbo nucifera]